ncbi:MAG: molybdopterin-dependent oxidoreductase [Acuticoccus sp.]
MLAALLLSLGLAANAPAQEASPSLIIDKGVFAEAGTEKKVRMTGDDLRALGTNTIEMSTVWTEGTDAFEVVPLAKILELHGLAGTPVEAIALNEYRIVLPPKISKDALLALSINGEALDPSEKGPFWIVFDFEDPKFANRLYQSAAVWQLYLLSAIAGNQPAE